MPGKGRIMVDLKISLEKYFIEPPEPQSHGGCGSCGTGKASAPCGNGLEKIYPTTAVRFGYMRYIGEFTHPPEMKFACGARVVIQTKRGIEIGDQVSLTCTGCDKSVTRDQMKSWVASCGQDSYMFNAGRILREATADDLAEYDHIQRSNKERRRFCQQVADQHKLAIRVVECESSFGGERIVFYFTSESRIDFRPIVQELTPEYQTRIEMRQVGARDEARLLADFETCGREVCCKTFLKTLRPITMRMAKLQKATLDPTQVSGRCGRLKCCLRYEHVGYEELDKKLPRKGVRIRTNHGEGVIVNRQVLTQIVQIRMDDNTLVAVVAEDITDVGVPTPPPSAKPEQPPYRTREQRQKHVRRDDPSGAKSRLASPEKSDAADRPKDSPPQPKAGESSEDKASDSATTPGRKRRRGRRRRGRRRSGGTDGSTGGSPSSPEP